MNPNNIPNKPGLGLDPSLIRLAPLIPKLIPDILDISRNELDPNRKDLKAESSLSDAELKSYAKSFNEVSTKYAEFSPFKKGIIEKISDLFSRFTRWLFRKEPPFPISDLEMKFSMNLFRTLDELPADKIDKKNPGQVPFSFVLNSWSKVLKQSQPDSTIPIAMKQCAQYQKSIEEIREGSWFRETRLGILQKKIARDIDKLKPDQTLLLPGGFNPIIGKGLLEMLIKLGKPEEKDKKTIEEALKLLSQIPMMYEVSKNSEGQIIFRVFHESILFHLGLDKMGDAASGIQMIHNMIANIKKPGDALSKNQQAQLVIDNLDSIFEFAKMDNGQLSMQGDSLKPFLNLGFRGSPSREYTLTPELLKSSLGDLLYPQVYTHKFETFGFFGKLKYGAKLAKGFIDLKGRQNAERIPNAQNGIKEADRIVQQLQALKDTPLEKVLEDYAPLKVFRVFREFRKKTLELTPDAEPKLSKLQVKLRLKPQGEKALEVFTKVHNIKTHKLNKLLLKTAVFLDIFHKTEGHLKDASWRKWIKETAYSLLKNVEKQFALHNGITTELGPDSAFRKQFDDILQKIEAAEVSEPLVLPNAPIQQKNVKPNFDDEPLVIDRNTIKMSSLKKVKPKSKQIKELSLQKVDLQFDTFDFSKSVTFLDQLSKNVQLDTLHAQVNDHFSMILKADREDKWKDLTPEKCQQWSEFILQLGMYQFRTHFGRKHSGFRPLEILQTLKSQEIVQKLCHLNEDVNHFKGFHIDTYPYREILKDAYLDLGIYAHEIFETLNRIERAGYSPVTLGSSGHAKDNDKIKMFENSHDRTFIEHLIRENGKSNTEGERKAYFNDFGDKGKLPIQIVHLRKISILSQINMARYLTVQCPSFKFVHWDAFVDPHVHGRYGPELENDFRKRYRARLMQEIDSRLYELNQPYFHGGKFSTHVGPFVAFHNYMSMGWMGSFSLNDIIGTFVDRVSHESLVPSIYEDIGESIETRNISERLFDGCVAKNSNLVIRENGSEYSHYGSKGINAWGFSDSYMPHYLPKGKIQTERTILDERDFRFPGLPYDISAELQMIQTDPESTRVQNTIGCLVKHCRLLNDPEHGAEFQRFFTTNLFRNGWLYRHIMQNPTYSSVIVKELERLFSTLSISRQYWGALRIMQITERCQEVVEQLTELSKKPPLPEDLKAVSDRNLKIEKELKSIDLEYRDPSIFAKLMPKFVEAGHTDLLEENSRKLAEACAENYKALSAWRNKTETDPDFQTERRRIHHAYLLHHAQRFMKNFYFSDIADISKDPVINTELQKILHSYTMKQRIPSTLREVNPEQEEMIEYFMSHVSPLVEKQLQDQKIRDAWIWELVPIEFRPQIDKRGFWKPETNYPIFACGSLRVDVRKGLFYNKDVALCPLPAEVTKDTICQKLFGSNLFSIQADHWYIKSSGKNGVMYQFKDADNLYRVALLPSQKPIIYKGYGQYWYQYQELTQLPQVTEKANNSKLKKELIEIAKTIRASTTPHKFLEHSVWISDSGERFIVEDHAKKPIYHGNLQIKNKKAWTSAASKSTIGHLRCIESLKEIEQGESMPILNPWDDSSFAQLSVFDTPKNIEATGSNGKVERFKYTKLGLAFCWNAKEARWDCETYKGYYLSKKNAQDIWKTPLFASNFRNYMVLEGEHKPPLILLSGEQYKAAARKDKQWSKNVHKRGGPMCPNGQHESLGIFVYTVDPIQGIKTSELMGYRYLAYQLFTQGKYQNAVDMLKMSQGLNTDASAPIDNWFETWNSNSFSSKAVLLQLAIMNMEQFLMQGRQNSDPEGFKKHLIKVAGLYAVYKAAQLKNALPATLLLKQKDEINFLAVIGNYSNVLTSIIDSFPKNPEFAHTSAPLQQLASAVKMATTAINLEMLQLDMLIAINAQRIKQPEFDDKDFKPTALFENIDAYLETIAGSVSDQLQKQTQEFGDSLKLQLKDKFSGNYGEKLAKEANDDIECARKKKAETSTKLKEENLSQLGRRLEKDRLSLTEKVEQNRKKIEAFFPKQQLDINSIKQYQQRLKRPDTTQEKIFRDAIFCYSSNNWASITWLQASQIEQIDNAVEEYLIQATQLQQLEKSIAAYYDFMEGPTDVKSELCARLLSQKRQYDTKKHHFRRAILPLEYDSQIIIRESQMYNVSEMSKISNLFMHQALAEGKTTVTRQLISKVKADGVHGAGIMTHAPLIEMHHSLLGKTANHAYGDNVYRLEFKRNDPSNVLALLNIYRNIKKMIAYNGRIDKTKKDLLSLHHALILKMEALETADEEQEKKLQEEIDILSDIFTLLHETNKDTTDEIDEILNAEQEHNYSIGNKISIDENRVNAGLEIMQWTLLSPLYADRFKLNKHYKMEEDEVKQYLIFVAGQVHQKYLPSANADLTLQYLTGLNAVNSQDELEKFFDDNIDKHANRNQIVALYKYLRFVLPGTFKRRGGVDYMRSEDGLLVKPCEKIGKAAEHSERGTEEETIWYTCLNYMDSTLGGVTKTQIGQIISSRKSKAAKEVLASQRNNPNGKSIKFEDTAPAKEFRKQFARYNLELQNLTESDYNKIIELVNSQPELLAEFLKDHVFSQIKITPEKIVGTPTDAVEIPKEFSGSSGTKNSYLTLPDKVQKIEKYAKQKGSDGAVLLALIKDYKDGDILPFDDSEDPTKEFAAQLKPGSAFIDLAPAYPGLSSLTIARKFAALKPGITFRFIDSDDRVKIIKNAFEEPTLAGEDLDLSKIITIFDRDHTRGTNLVLGTGVECFTTISPKSNFSAFLQAVMRARKLGQGQKIRYFVDRKSINKMGEKPSLENVISLVIENEEKALQYVHYKAEKQKIKGVSKTRLFRALYTIGNQKNRVTNKAQIYALRKQIWKNNVRDYFIQKTSDDLSKIGKPEKLQNPQEVLKKMTTDEITNMKEFLKNPLIRDNIILRKEVINAYFSLTRRTIIPAEFLPKEVYNTKEEQDQAQEVEREQEQEQAQEQEQEVEQDQEQEQELSNIQTKKENAYISFYVHTLPELIDKMKTATNVQEDMAAGNYIPGVTSDEDFKIFRKNIKISNRNFTRMQQYIYFYDHNITFTRNFMETRKFAQDEFFFRDSKISTSPWGTQKPQEKLPAHQSRVQRFAIAVDKRDNQVHALLGTAKDFDANLEDLDSKPNPDIDYYIYNLYRDDLDGRQNTWNNYPVEIQEKIAMLIVQIKFFNGEIDLIKPENPSEFDVVRNEFNTFKKWLIESAVKEGGNDLKIQREFLKNLEANLKKYLKEWRPSLLPDYPTSTMAKAFKESIKSKV